jgi:hypothetical protein
MEEREWYGKESVNDRELIGRVVDTRTSSVLV